MPCNAIAVASATIAENLAAEALRQGAEGLFGRRLNVFRATEVILDQLVRQRRQLALPEEPIPRASQRQGRTLPEAG